MDLQSHTACFSDYKTDVTTEKWENTDNHKEKK